MFIGFGVCLIVEVAMDKYDGVFVWYWVVYGIFVLLVFNSGLSIFGDFIL